MSDIQAILLTIVIELLIFVYVWRSRLKAGAAAETHFDGVARFCAYSALALFLVYFAFFYYWKREVDNRLRALEQTVDIVPGQAAPVSHKAGGQP